MKTPERLLALRAARQTIRIRDQKIARIKNRLKSITASKGVAIGPELSDELETIIEETSPEIEALPTTDFRRVFWNQQVDVDVHDYYTFIHSIYNLGDCHEDKEE